MIDGIEKDELRHRIKQTPFRSWKARLGIRLWSVDPRYSVSHHTA